MKKATKLISLLGALSLVAGGVAFGLTSPEKTAAADSTTSSSSTATTTVVSAFTPGNVVYLNITNTSDDWWGSGSYKYSFVFTGVNSTTSKSIDVRTPFATRAVDGTRFYLASVPVFPSGVTAWDQIVACCYLATATSANEYIATSTPIMKADSATINEFYTNEKAAVGTSADPLYNQALSQKGWTSSRPNVDYLSGWAGIFLAQTNSACSGATSQASLDYCWSDLSSSYALLNSTSKGFFTSTTNTEFKTPLYTPDTSTAINTALSAKGRYIYILKKYTSDNTLTNFASMTLSSFTSSAVIPQPTASTDPNVLVISLGALAAVVTASYFFLKKKKIRA